MCKKTLPFVFLFALLVACVTPPAPEIPTPTLAPASNEIVEFESLTFPGHLWTPFMPPPEEGTA
ncbi:MAG: hypothetical protein HC804_07555, partial [Anaerolineae bacterium]|nr:hypothetical protein [Anaerolineae bacterium]